MKKIGCAISETLGLPSQAQVYRGSTGDLIESEVRVLSVARKPGIFILYSSHENKQLRSMILAGFLYIILFFRIVASTFMNASKSVI